MVVFLSSLNACIPVCVRLVLLASLLVQNHRVYNANCTRGSEEGTGDNEEVGDDEDVEGEKRRRRRRMRMRTIMRTVGDDDEHRDDGVDHDIKLSAFVAILL
jgi:hypothetical protein